MSVCAELVRRSLQTLLNLDGLLKPHWPIGKADPHLGSHFAVALSNVVEVGSIDGWALLDYLRNARRGHREPRSSPAMLLRICVRKRQPSAVTSS
jgi:hypothetical protein